MQYLIKAKNIILLLCIVSTFVLGVLTIPVYAAGKKCTCGVKGCKVCNDGCKGKKCAHISVRWRKKDGTNSTEHPYEKAVSCKKHPKLAQQGIVSMTYRYENKSWKHLDIALFADDSCISYNADSKKYLAKNASNGSITVDDSTLAGQYAKKHKLDLYDMNDRDKKLVAGKSDSGSSDSGSGKGGNSEDFKKALRKLNKNLSDEDCAEFSVVIAALKADGETDNAIAGILSNMIPESAGSAYAIEEFSGKKCDSGETYTQFKTGKSYKYSSPAKSADNGGIGKRGSFGAGHGIVQWSFGRAKNLFKFAESHKDKFANVKVTHYGILDRKGSSSTNYAGTVVISIDATIPTRAGQTAFMIEELNSKSYKPVKDAINKASSAEEAASIFYDKYEVGPSKYKAKHLAKSSDALKAVQAFSGAMTTSGSDSDETKNIGDVLNEEGFWSENQLSSYTKLVEPELTDQVANSDRSTLTQEETEGLSDWQMNVQRSHEHKGLATLFNYALTVIGVLAVIWGSVFYMAYWFDMINPFVDLDLVSRLSLGRFTASHELNGSCTWHMFSGNKETHGTRQQTINSKVALFISVCAILVGVLIISGGLYRIVRSVFYEGAVLFHQIFG